MADREFGKQMADDVLLKGLRDALLTTGLMGCA
jgi:hypothetical protein